MVIQNFEDSLKLASEFLPKKERKNYFEFKVIEEPFAEYVCYLNELSNEEVERLRELKAKYQEAFVEHLSEALDEDAIDGLNCGDELVDIDLDYVQHQYRFKVHHLYQDGTVRSYDRMVTLTDEEYARLLAWHVFDNHLVINTLRYRDSSLYNWILRGVDLYYWEDGIAITQDDPYLVTMDEAKADAAMIVKENGIKQTSGYLCISI
jgi:hypothetical protein